MKISLNRKRPDWYVVPAEMLPQIGFSPVVELLPSGDISIHRSHLPLLEGTEDFLKQLNDSGKYDKAAYDENSSKLNWKLRDYQHVGREFILARRGTLLADVPRMGKSITSASTHSLSDGPLLIVAPLQTREVWLKELKRLFPNVEPLVLTGRRMDSNILDNNDHQIIFTHYDIVSSWRTLGAKTRFGTLILDEIHYLSNGRSKRTLSAQMLSLRADRVIGLSGTPLWNRPSGLFAILNCVCPGSFGKFLDYANRYCDPVLGPYGTSYKGCSNVDEFKKRISEIMLRRTWQDVRDQLPPVSRSSEVAEVTEEQNFRLEEMAERIRDAGSKRVLIGEMARARKFLFKIKKTVVLETVKNVLDSGEPVVVWAWHRETANQIADALNDDGYKALVATGDSTVGVRDVVMAEWKGSSTPTALVMTISVGQVGLNLSHACHAVFAEVDWTPANISQAEMRTYTPERPMFVTYIVADHRIDRSLVDAIKEKCEISNTIGVPAADMAVEAIAKSFYKEGEEGNMDRLMSMLLEIDGVSWENNEDSD